MCKITLASLCIKKNESQVTKPESNSIAKTFEGSEEDFGEEDLFSKEKHF